MKFLLRCLSMSILAWTVALCTSCAVDHHFIRADSETYREMPRFARSHYFDSNGYTLHAWYVPAVPPVKGTILHFHGNGKNLTHHYLYSEWFRGVGYNVFIFDYRGYGESEGAPTIDGMVDDGCNAFNYVMRMKREGPRNLFIFAQSIGTVPAIQALSKIPHPPVKGVILDSAIASMKRLGYEHLKRSGYMWPLYYMPWLIVPGRFTNITAIAEIPPTPFLLIHGKDDALIYSGHSSDLAKRIVGKKELHIMEGVGHVDAFSFHLGRTKPLTIKFLDTVDRGSNAPSK